MYGSLNKDYMRVWGEIKMEESYNIAFNLYIFVYFGYWFGFSLTESARRLNLFSKTEDCHRRWNIFISMYAFCVLAGSWKAWYFLLPFSNLLQLLRLNDQMQVEKLKKEMYLSNVCWALDYGFLYTGLHARVWQDTKFLFFPFFWIGNSCWETILKAWYSSRILVLMSLAISEFVWWLLLSCIGLWSAGFVLLCV